MPFLLIVSISVVPLILGFSLISIFGQSRFKNAFFVFLFTGSIWQLDVAVLYSYQFFSVNTIDLLFRLLRFGSIMITPALFYVAFIMYQDLVNDPLKSKFLRIIMSKYTVGLFIAWGLVVYGMGWTHRGVDHLQFIDSSYLNYLFPVYGKWQSLFNVNVLLFIIIMILVAVISRKVSEVLMRKFLNVFLVSLSLAYLIGILNFFKKYGLFSSGIAMMIFSITVFTTFITMQTKKIENMQVTLEDVVSELQYLDKLKDGFIASLSHELRTPITAIMGSMDVLKRGLLGEMNSGQMEVIDMSSSAVERLLNQVNELLDFAKLKNGNFELNYTDETMDAVIEEALQVVLPLLDKKQQRLSLQTESEFKIRMDKQRILQVLINLLSNANKFSPQNTKISLKSYIKSDKVFIEITDLGIGIPVEKQKYIFTKFFQVNNNLKGTGLGLAISKELIESHGGRIWFETNEHKGSKFIFFLPIINELQG